MYWCDINIHKLHPLPEKIGLGSADFLHCGTGYIEIAVFVLLLIFCRFQSEFLRTSTARSGKFNHDFNHENWHSGTGYIEKPYLFHADLSHYVMHSGKSRENRDEEIGGAEPSPIETVTCIVGFFTLPFSALTLSCSATRNVCGLLRYLLRRSDMFAFEVLRDLV